MRKNKKPYATQQALLFFLHFKRVHLKLCPQTAQEYWCGVEQSCPPRHSDPLPLLVLLHNKHKTASVLNSGFGLMTGLTEIILGQPGSFEYEELNKPESNMLYQQLY